MPSLPLLLYVYPWMPYPRRTLIYLREHSIPSSLVTVVPVSDPPSNRVVGNFPPKPAGTLPILVIPADGGDEPVWIRQSNAIIAYLEEMRAGSPTWPRPRPSELHAGTALARARALEILIHADECMTLWDVVRMTGSKVKARAEGGTATTNAAVSKEVYELILKRMTCVNQFLGEREMAMELQREGRSVSPAEIVLFCFLEFVDGFYGRDVSAEKDLENLRSFYEGFKLRKSVEREGMGRFPVEMRKDAVEWDPAAL